jgi:hypothetical protein
MRCRVEELIRASPAMTRSDLSRAIGFLAEHLTEESLGTALAAVRAITDEAERGKGIQALAPYLSADQLTLALETATTLADADARIDVLVAVAQNLPKSSEGSLSTALTAVQAIEDETRRSRGIKALAPYLPAGQLAAALDVATKLEDVNARAPVLVAVAKHLSEEAMEKFLRRVASYDSDTGHPISAGPVQPGGRARGSPDHHFLVRQGRCSC